MSCVIVIIIIIVGDSRVFKISEGKEKWFARIVKKENLSIKPDKERFITQNLNWCNLHFV